MNSIFVMIASYRDYELVPTIRDLLAKSSGENSITLGVVWQKDETETLAEFAHKDNIRIVDVHWTQSKGLGWARSVAQSLYKNEDYILQLDSHHRFCSNWDKILINMMNMLKNESEKPFLTSYAAGYDPSNDKVLHDTPSKILPRDFKKSGTIWFNPVAIPNSNSLTRPIRARLVSGHYYFTSGSHITDFPYDPDMYFAGDEITLSVRSFTAGYDLYHPHKNVVWHHYGRLDRIKHWGDHNDQAKKSGSIDKTWAERDEYSKKRIRQMLGMENNNIDLGRYGLGRVRSLADYERYSGFDFKNRRISKDAVDGIDPPAVYKNDDQWEKSFKKQYSIETRNWPRYVYLQNLDKLSHVRVNFVALKQEVVYSEELSLDKIKSMNDNLYQTSFVTDNVPMKIEYQGMKGDETVYSWSHDTMSHVHWF